MQWNFVMNMEEKLKNIQLRGKIHVEQDRRNAIRGRGGIKRDLLLYFSFFFSSRRRHTRFDCDWSSDVCSSDLRLSRQRRVRHPRWPPEQPPGGRDHLLLQLRADRVQLLEARETVGSCPWQTPEIGRASCRERV